MSYYFKPDGFEVTLEDVIGFIDLKAKREENSTSSNQVLDDCIIDLLQEFDTSRQITRSLFFSYIEEAEKTNWISFLISRPYRLCFRLGEILSDRDVHEKLLQLALRDGSTRSVNHQLELMPGRTLTQDETWAFLKRAVKKSHGNSHEWANVIDFADRHDLTDSYRAKLDKIIQNRVHTLDYSID